MDGKTQRAAKKYMASHDHTRNLEKQIAETEATLAKLRDSLAFARQWEAEDKMAYDKARAADRSPAADEPERIYGGDTKVMNDNYTIRDNMTNARVTHSHGDVLDDIMAIPGEIVHIADGVRIYDPGGGIPDTFTDFIVDTDGVVFSIKDTADGMSEREVMVYGPETLGFWSLRHSG